MLKREADTELLTVFSIRFTFYRMVHLISDYGVQTYEYLNIIVMRTEEYHCLFL